MISVWALVALFIIKPNAWPQWVLLALIFGIA